MTESEVEAVVSMIAASPDSGVEVSGTGGCRKVRVAGRDKGKSGGYRVITFFTGPDIPVFLLTVFSKGERADLSGPERVALARLTKTLVSAYRKKSAGIGARE